MELFIMLYKVVLSLNTCESVDEFSGGHWNEKY